MRFLTRALILSIVFGVQSTTAGVRRADVVQRPLPTRAIGYYDASLRRVVIVGGEMELRAGARDGVWSWSGTRWEPVTDSGPPLRGAAAAAYDARRELAVFAGGAARNDSTFATVGESWVTAPAGWRRMTGADISARDHHAMVYDEDRGSVLLFGGIPGDHSTPWPSDTWSLDADGWSRIAGSGPEGRARASMVYDGRRHQVVLFGGVGAQPSRDQPQPWFADTWILEKDAWRKVADVGPRARYAHGMAFDERAGVVLLYGGAAAHRDAPLGDMWQWDGTRWTEISLTGTTPGYRYQPVMVYDRARGRTVLYGGDPARTDTWEWDGKRWSEIR
jgi:hypothetical protein